MSLTPGTHLARRTVHRRRHDGHPRDDAGPVRCGYRGAVRRSAWCTVPSRSPRHRSRLPTPSTRRRGGSPVLALAARDRRSVRHATRVLRHPAVRHRPSWQLPRRPPQLGGAAGQPRLPLLRRGSARDHRVAGPEAARPADARDGGGAARLRHRSARSTSCSRSRRCGHMRSSPGSSTASRGSAG